MCGVSIQCFLLLLCISCEQTARSHSTYYQNADFSFVCVRSLHLLFDADAVRVIDAIYKQAHNRNKYKQRASQFCVINLFIIIYFLVFSFCER